MDRTSWIGLILCLVLMLAWQSYVAWRWPMKPRPPAAPPAAAERAEPAVPLPAEQAAREWATPQMRPVQPGDAWAPPTPSAAPTAELENDLMRAVFTADGGGIKQVFLKKHPAEGDLAVSLNHESSRSVFDVRGWSAEPIAFALASTDGAVTMTARLETGAEIRREFRLGPDYQIELRQDLTNSGTAPVQLPDGWFHLGTAAPLTPTEQAMYVSSGWLTASGSYRQYNVHSFDPTTILGLTLFSGQDLIVSDPEAAPLQWATVKDQFFAMIMTPPQSWLFAEVRTRPATLPPFPNTLQPARGIEAEARLPGFALAPGQVRSDSFSFYAGPKEYAVLKSLGRDQEKAMDFGWTGFAVVPLLTLLNWIHTFFADFKWGWGWTIIATTVVIKIILWPLQSSANHAMKKMQALQPKVNALREKYPDNPEKMNAEMIQLYREYGVNPVGGCLPMLVQMPIFIGFYVMLQSAVELRGQSFLWVKDLTLPDTVAVIAGIPINPLPLIMTATTVMLMRMTPQAQDNPQMKVLQWMPVVFLVILYNFAAALALYWTVNNLISMVQTYRNLRKPLPELKRVPKPKWSALDQAIAQKEKASRRDRPARK